MFDWLKLKTFKLNPKPPELIAQTKEIDSSYVSNIVSKYNKDLQAWDDKMKIVDKED